MSSNPNNFFLSREDIEALSRIVEEDIGLKRSVDTGWPWPFEYVQDFFEDMYNAIMNIPRRVWDYIKDHLIEPITEWVDRIGEYLSGIFGDAYKATLEEIKDIRTPWRQLVLPFSLMKNFVATGVLKPLLEKIESALGKIKDAFTEAISPIAEPVRDFIGDVKGFFTEKIPEFFESAKSFFTDLVKHIAELPGLLRELFFEKLPETIAKGFRSLWDLLVNEVVPGLKDEASKALGALKEGYMSLFRRVIDNFRALPSRLARGELEAAGELLLDTLFLSVATIAPLDLLTTQVLGVQVNLTAVKNILSKIIDPELITGIFFGVLAAESLRKPLEYWARSTFRTTIPGVGDLITFYKLNRLSREELYEWMRKHGYADSWIDLYEYSSWTLPRFYDVFAAYTRGTISERDFHEWLKILNIKTEPRPGLETPDIEIFREGAYRLPSPFYIVYAAETGVIPEETIKVILRDALYHPKYLDILSKSIYARSLLSEMREAARQVLRDYVDGVLSRDEAAEQLRSLGKRDDDLKILLPAYENQRLRMIRRKALSEYEKMYREGAITREEFIRRLEEYGYDREILEKYADLLDDVVKKYDIIKSTRDERTRLANLFVKEAKEGILDDRQLRERLEALKLYEPEIELRLLQAAEEYASEVTDLWIDYYKELFRHGMIDADAFETALLDLGIRPEKARALRNYYETKYSNIDRKDLSRDERNALRSILVKLYTKGALHRDELAARLAELGYSDEEINLTLERADREYEDNLREIRLDILREQMKQGLLERQVFVDNCVKIGYSSEKCEELAELYWERYIGLDYYHLTRDERSALANTIAKMYIRGFLTLDEVYQELSALGFSEQEIALRIKRMQYEDAMEMLDDIIRYYDELLRQEAITEQDYINALVGLGVREDRAKARALYVLRKIKAKELLPAA